MPRNEKKPTTSVTVVRMIDDAVAGSWPKRRSSIGTSAPASPAASIEITIASMITPTSGSERLQT